MSRRRGAVTGVNHTQTPEEAFAQLEQQSVGEFSKHVLTKESENIWLCGEPGHSAFYFRLCFVPYHVVFVGDLGCQTYCVNDFNSLRWLLGSVDSRDYVLGKAEHPSSTFFLKDALAYLAEQKKEYPDEAEQYEEIEAALDNIDEMPPDYLWQKAWFDVMGDCEAPQCTDWDSQMLVQYLALKIFCKLYWEQQPPEEVSTQPSR
jgi:hypothetical protein